MYAALRGYVLGLRICTVREGVVGDDVRAQIILGATIQVLSPLLARGC